jgi:hypothetical protein
MLPGTIEIDLGRAWEALIGQIPNPFGSFAHHDLLFRPAPAALPSFQVDSLAKFFGGFKSMARRR